jgi:hypothetical protein
VTSVTATELQLLACFGVEPQLLDASVPWCYNDAAYSIELDGFSVTFAIQPSYRAVRLIVARGQQRLYELNAVGVADVRVIDEPNVDAVEVLLTESSWLLIRFRPVFEITQGFERLVRS